jgi:hypothetical protein
LEAEMPKNQHHPTPEEQDERVKVDLPPEEFIAKVMETGPHPEDDKEPGEKADK